MTTDFRALCVELVESVEALLEMRSPNAGRMWTTERRLRVARAALADKPAVPTVMEIVELSSEIEAAGLGQVDFARAVLARWGNPAPQPPADGEVAELVARLSAIRNDYGARHSDDCQRAAELLQRQAPVPIPVTERLSAPEDCDAEGMCWWWHPSHPESGYSEGWMLRPRAWGAGHYDLDDRLTHTHWLPAHALPLPEVSE